MTKEQRIVFGLSDIKSIRLMCRKCEEPTYFSLKKSTTAPHNCPHCKEQWILADNSIKELKFVSRFRELVKDLDNGELLAEIQFEIEDHKK